ncbi:MAG: Trk system potassium transporter TrkA [Lachnospiraceae bacterium]|nr:Trk system potassium transporter TrkA [Lachnospiraceae bacterium]
MNIIIVGCGKVGYTLVEQLSNEEHNIVVVDKNADKVQYITDNLDAMGIIGNGVSHQTLLEAGVSNADLVIAVTGSDEENLLCCLIAKKTGNCQTIARVRNPIYNSEIDFLKEEFGLAMIINPELTAAREIARMFQFPSAIRVDSFARGHIEMLHCKLTKDSPLIGVKLANLHQKLKVNVLVCEVIRGEDVIIPNGNFVFQEGDIIAIASSRKNAMTFFKNAGIMKNPVKNAILAGGGKISYYLAKALITSGIDVTIIEQNPSRADFLSEELPEATIILGDATDQSLLEQEEYQTADGFACLTGLDEENILLALHVNANSKAKTVTKVNRISFQNVIDKLDLGSIIYPRVTTADYIVKYVRSASAAQHDNNVETLYKLANGKAEALEFNITDKSGITDIPLQQLKIRKNTLIGSIYRNGNVIFPGGQDMIKVGDTVMVVLSGYRLSDIEDILEDRA